MPFLTDMSNMTNVVGYYNGNRWPIQIVASKFNITLTLKPGEYILDRAGRKINDPYFEVFVTNKQLHKEVSEAQVPLIAVPVVTAPAAATNYQANPVRAVTQWTRDSRGVRQPVLTQPQPDMPTPTLPAAVVASASESVTPMSMEEARRRGLVRKVREVPEDYGVNDTTGLPPGNIPKMKYAIDPSVNRPAPPLPKEMLTLPKDDPNRQTRSQLVSNLAQGVKVPPPEEAPETPFANTAVVNGPPNSPIVAGSPAPIVEEQAEVAEPPVEEAVPEPMPEPELAEAAVPVQPVVPAPPPMRPVTPKDKFVCMACGAPHKFRSQLYNHAKAKHGDRLNAIMAVYPETPPAPPPLR
jgi:hypothetical protein